LGGNVIRTATTTAARTLAGIFPELSLGLTLFTVLRDRVRAEDPERGDAIQWVIVTAIGAAIAITVGTIIYNKLQTKANNIDITTPGPNQ
jgi:hypothetical protein